MDGSYDGSYGQSGDQKKRSVEDADDDAYVACFRAKQRLWRHLEIVTNLSTSIMWPGAV